MSDQTERSAQIADLERGTLADSDCDRSLKIVISSLIDSAQNQRDNAQAILELVDSLVERLSPPTVEESTE